MKSIRFLWQRTPRRRPPARRPSHVFFIRLLATTLVTISNVVTAGWLRSLWVASSLTPAQIKFFWVLLPVLAMTLAHMWFLTSVSFVRWMQSRDSTEEWNAQPKPN